MSANNDDGGGCLIILVIVVICLLCRTCVDGMRINKLEESVEKLEQNAK